MSERRPDWDEARLEAAFGARAARAPGAPSDLADAVVAGLAPRSRSVASRARPWLPAAAAVAVLVSIVGLQLLPREDPSRPLASATPPATSAIPASPSAAVEQAAISVPDALRVRDTGSDRELVVAGFLSALPRLPCPAIFGPRNPTHLQCPESFQWLMADPEIVFSRSGGGPPKGPAFHPSFALVDAPEVPIPATGAVAPVPVVLMGHFHDRRAALCPAARDGDSACGDTFVVDQVASVNGEPRGVATRLRNERFDDATQQQVTDQPRDLVADVDRLVLDQVPGGFVMSRQLVTIGQVIGIEPILANDDFVPYVGNPATLMWIVTVLDARADLPRARTFALFDASNWFGEVTATGMRMIERSGSAPPPTSSGPPIPSADPTAFDAAPTSVVGLEVRTVADVVGERRSGPGVDHGTSRDEFAIRAWYVGPDPTVTCPSGREPEGPVHPPSPPCDEQRHWLLDRPETYGTEVGQLRRDPEPYPRALNPILPVDVPFDVPSTRNGGAVVPQPVVVLGHFNGAVDAFHGNVYFVIDALAWTRDGPVASLDTLTRLTGAATEDPATVLARIAEVSPNEPVATWTTVVDAADFAALDPNAAEDAREFLTGPPVWVVRRLIRNEMDGRQRLAVERAYTADHGARVWWTETPDSPADLATTIDVGPFGEHTRQVRVFDYGQWIVSVRRATAADNLTWQPTNPKRDGIIDVARGATDRDVGVRWTGGACAPDWRLLVHIDPRRADSDIYVEAYTFGDPCSNPSETVTRALVLSFDRPIDLDRVRSSDGSCCG